MKSRKIAFWCPEFRTSQGGIQQYSRLLVQALGEMDGIEVRVVSFGTGGPLRHLQRVFFFLHVILNLLCYRPGLIIMSHLHLARLHPILRAMGVPFWICLHGVECWDVQRPLDILSLKHASRLLPVSRFTADKILSFLPNAHDRLRLLPNHVQAPTHPRMERLAARRILGLPGEATLLLTVSRLARAESYKGHRQILDALPIVKTTHPQLAYAIVGEGDDRPFLTIRAEETGLASSVFFLGQLDASRLEAAYAACDFFVMPSTGEGFGIVYLEALIRGLPVLAGNRDASCDPLQGGRCGLLVDPLSREALARGLEDLITRPWDREELVKRTKETFGVHLLPGRLRALLEES